MLHTLDEETIINVLSLGVQGYLTATSGTKHLIQAIRAISRDEIWAERRILTKVMRRVLAPREETLIIKPKLTKREEEILNLIVQGYRNKPIADKLFISENTVKNHIRNIFRKLGINNRLNLILNFGKSISKTHF
ncbi:MAG: hypothetical protein C4291_04675 [Candidatus Dadabacteria bacterium]